MDVSRKKLYLTEIAEDKGITGINVLSTLMRSNIIFAFVEDVHVHVKAVEPDETISSSRAPTLIIKIMEEYLQSILRKGGWTGKVMYSTIILDADSPDGGKKKFNMFIQSDTNITLAIEDLFVFEEELRTLEDETPNIFEWTSVTGMRKNRAESIEQSPPQNTAAEEVGLKEDKSSSPFLLNFEEIIGVDPNKVGPALVVNNYLLIGILLEFLVGERKGITFKNQSELAQHIHDEYYKLGIKGVSLRNVQSKFGIGNALSLMLNKAMAQLDEALIEARS